MMKYGDYVKYKEEIWKVFHIVDKYCILVPTGDNDWAGAQTIDLGSDYKILTKEEAMVWSI